jgi:HD-GYP domain-containing protein (c-di-GMP phosphodiesterase class II)
MKEGKLTRSERYEVQKHPVLGLHLLERIPNLPVSTPLIAYQSHERENTKGYPKKRGKLLISNYSKIVQIADIFIALISTRPYRKAYMPYKAMEILIKLTKEGVISGEYVKAFLTYASLFPVGSLVELNDRRIGKIINANGSSFAKPVLSILTDTDGRLLPKDKIFQIDLSHETDTHVVRALKLGYLKDVSLMDGF